MTTTLQSATQPSSDPSYSHSTTQNPIQTYHIRLAQPADLPEIRQHHVRYHHHQRRALGDLLIKPEPHAKQRNRNQATANAKDPAQCAQGGAEQQVQQKIHHNGNPLTTGGQCYALAPSGETHSNAQWLCRFCTSVVSMNPNQLTDQLGLFLDVLESEII